MSGVEVAGLALGLLPAFVKAFSTYASLLEVLGPFRADNDAGFNIRRIQVLAERARFESWIQQVSKFKTIPDPTVMEAMASAEKQIKAQFAILETLLAPHDDAKASFNRKIMLAIKLENIVQAINNLKILNDSLWSLLEVNKLHKRATDETESSRTTESDPVASREALSTIASTVDDGTKDLDQPQPATTILEPLVKNCGAALKLLASYATELSEVSNSFQLWKHAVESENLYSAIMRMPEDLRNIPLHNLLQVHYQAISHIGEIILQAESAFKASGSKDWRDKMRELHETLLAAQKSCPGLEHLDLSEFPELEEDQEKLREFAISEIKMVMDTIRDCLPSTINFARCYSGSYEPAAMNIPAQAVGELLDMSVDLIQPATEALETAQKAVEIEGRKGDVVDYDSIKAVFEKQAACLREWKDKYRPNIEKRLASRNPAKLESIAEAVCNITHLLNTMPALTHPKSTNQDLSADARKLLSEYSNSHPHLALPSKIHRPQGINAAVESFETYVQSLVALEVSLDLVDPPPPYTRRGSSDDVMVIDMTGRVIEPVF